MEPFVGQICLFPWNWAPEGWAACDGRLLQVSENPTLYSLLLGQFGGDGKTTFALPKMAPIKAQGGGEIGYFINLRGDYPRRP